MVITITPLDLVWNQDALDRTHILLKINQRFLVLHFADTNLRNIR